MVRTLEKRRQFLKLAAVGGAAVVSAGAIGEALAQAPDAFAPAAMPGFDVLPRDRIWHVLSRLTFGVTPDLYTQVRSMGAEAFIEDQLHPDGIDDSDCDERLTAYPDIDENSGVLLDRYQNQPGRVVLSLMGAWGTRAIYSKRQLFERMVHFWTDHFNVYIGKNLVLYLKVDDDRDVIRPSALRRFRDILGASAHSPAMLYYLDNFRSDQRAPNENYARELLELHTMGVNGGYTEDDVKEVARCFTGWSISNPRLEGDGTTQFRFRPNLHDRGEKVVLGQVIPAGGGEEDGELVLDILAQHPSTARFISTKLARRFVSDFPPDSLVDSLTQTYLSTDGDIPSLLRVMFAADEFWNAPPKFKRPFEHSVGALRALNYDVQSNVRFLRFMRYMLESLGHVPFNWPAPNGYPDVGGYWMNNLLPRWNMTLATAFDAVDGAELGIESLVALIQNSGIPLEFDPVMHFIARYLIGRDLTDDELTITRDFALSADVNNEGERILVGMSLLLASPGYQYR